MSDFVTLDFKVIKEFWDSYLLSDDTKLKSRVVLTGVKKSKMDKSKEYEFNFQSIQSFIFSDKSTGPTHKKMYTKEEMESSYKKEITFSTTSEKWNEYLLDDNTTSKIEKYYCRHFQVGHLFTKWRSNLQCKDQGIVQS